MSGPFSLLPDGAHRPKGAFVRRRPGFLEGAKHESTLQRVCTLRRTQQLARHQLAVSRTERQRNTDLNHEGNTGRQVAAGENSPTLVDPLVLRQGISRATSD